MLSRTQVLEVLSMKNIKKKAAAAQLMTCPAAQRRYLKTELFAVRRIEMIELFVAKDPLVDKTRAPS